MEDSRTMSILNQAGAILKGHFLYTSGLHGEAYINKDAVYPHTEFTEEICRMMVNAAKDLEFSVVAGPAIGGAILSHEIARIFKSVFRKDVLGVFADKIEGNLKFKRGYEKIIPGRKVLVVEDILNTGGSAKRIVEAVRNSGGKVVGVVVIVNRGGVTAEMLGDVPFFFSLLKLNLRAWKAEECPLCEEGISMNTDVGKAKK